MLSFFPRGVSGEILNVIESVSEGFPSHSFVRPVFYTLYTTLPDNLVKDKLVNLIERIFKREGSHNISCNDRHAFSPLVQFEFIIYGLVRKYVKLSPLT